MPPGAVAIVDGDPIWPPDVQTQIRAVGPRVGTAPAIDPRRRALDAAIRVRLFVQEAKRRGLAAPDGPPAVVDAYLVQGLLRQEWDRRKINASRISDNAAEQYYGLHRLKFNTPESVRVQAIVVADPNLAESLLRQAGEISNREFEALVSRVTVASGPAPELREFLIDLHYLADPADGVDDSIYPVALQLRRPGEVGLAIGSDGQRYVLRAIEINIEIEPWNPELAQRVRNIMVWEEEQRVADELDRRLRTHAAIVVDEEALRLIAAIDGASAAGQRSPFAWAMPQGGTQ